MVGIQDNNVTAETTNNLYGHFILATNLITLCTYAQQGYAFGLVLYIYMLTKNRLFIVISALPLKNLLLSVICYLLAL